MKIAFCVSGIPRSGVGNKEQQNEDFERDLQSHKKAFPTADFYYGTWQQYESDALKIIPKNSEFTTFEEPKMFYHPFYDIPDELKHSIRLKNIVEKYKTITDERQDRYRHQTKQILSHAFMLDYFDLKDNYDIILRSRYDTYIYESANFRPILDQVYLNKSAIGFALPKNAPFNTLKKLARKDKNCYKFLFDSLIIHSNEVFDTENVYDLHEKGELLPCEFGWYQTMSMPYDDNHECYTGWANANRSIPKEYLK